VVARRHFLQLLGGGVTSLLAGVGGLDQGLDQLAVVRGGPDGPSGGPWQDGREQIDRLDGLDGIDGPDGTDGMDGMDGGEALDAVPAISRARVVVPMFFPVLAGATYSDTFLACRDGCRRKHLGQDLFAPKLRPVVATFDATVTYLRTGRPTAGNLLSIASPDGWTTNYLHLNNDSPGTDDGIATPELTFADGLRPGARVRAGQLLGWVGDSGNAEQVSPHLHFELRKGDAWNGMVHNPLASLDLAERLTAPIVAGPLPEGVVARAAGVGGLWVIERGHRRPIAAGVHAANGLAAQPVVRVAAEDLKAHPAGSPVPLRDGLVVRAPDGRLWVVLGGCRHPLLPDGLRRLGVDDRAVRKVDADALATVGAEGVVELGPVRSGGLLRAQGTPEVWLVTADGGRRHVPDQTTLGSWGWRQTDVAEVPAAALDPLKVGAPVPLRDGTLAVTPDRAIHLISGGRRRKFASRAAATAAGWPLTPLRAVTAEALGRVPLGFPMP
jgi:hypothetical protein